MNFEFTNSNRPKSLFPLGQVVATHGALDLLDRSATNAFALLQRHRAGDWGDIHPEDAIANREAVRYGTRVLSSYTLGNNAEPLWIITEADRSVTTLLLPSEY